MQIILKVEQYMEQSQGENTQQVLSLSQLDRKGQQINSAVQQAGFTLSRIRPRGEVRDDVQQIRGNTYVRVTVEPVSDEDAQAAIDESRGAHRSASICSARCNRSGCAIIAVIQTSRSQSTCASVRAAAVLQRSSHNPQQRRRALHQSLTVMRRRLTRQSTRRKSQRRVLLRRQTRISQQQRTAAISESND
jgi:hypothetical protein